MNKFKVVLSEETTKESVIEVETEKEFEDVMELLNNLEGINEDHRSVIMNLLQEKVRIVDIQVLQDLKEIKAEELEQIEEGEDE